MYSFLRNGIGLVLLFSFVNTRTLAQIDVSKLEVGVTGGIFVYQGDLTPSPIGSYRTLKPTFNLFVNRTLTGTFSLRTSLFYGGLMGNDAAYSSPEWRQQRNLAFNTRNIELSELLVWRAWRAERGLVPYVFGGIGASFLNIKRDWSRFNPEFFTSENLAARVAEDISHSTPTVLPVIPVGIGLQYSISKKLCILAETVYRFTRTDYLDGFSKAGNPRLNDHYQSHTIGLLYKFGRKDNLNCPTTF
ncbi:MAG TPA: DUF6089 family protein [Flavisolibacter sp.]